MQRLSLSLVRIAALAALIIGLVFTQQSARAHGDIEVGDYTLVVGWINEPAYVGFPNGLDLRVENHETGEPVVGLEDSLEVTIIMGDSEKGLDIRPRFGVEGAYTADILPTEAGDYTFIISGEIDGTEVEDIEVTSGPDTFSSVEATDEVAFPPSEASTDAATPSATVLSFIALGLGLLGLILGGLALARKSS